MSERPMPWIGIDPAMGPDRTVIVFSNPRGTDPGYMERLMQISERERRALVDGTWPDPEPPTSGRAIRQRYGPRNYLERLEAENNDLRRDLAEARADLEEARRAAGWSNDNSPALGGR